MPEGKKLAYGVFGSVGFYVELPPQLTGWMGAGSRELNKIVGLDAKAPRSEMTCMTPGGVTLAHSRRQSLAVRRLVAQRGGTALEQLAKKPGLFS